MITDILNKFDKIIKNTSTINRKNNHFNSENYIVISHYEIDAIKRLLIVGNNKYNIPVFFNINNALAVDYNNLDYILTYFGFNISNYLKKEYKSSNNTNNNNTLL